MNVVELLEKEGIRYTSAGKDVLIHCLNPNHEDNNPSMRIDRITGMMGCFSCGFGGNLFTHFNKSVDTTSIKVIQLKKKIRDITKNELLLPPGKSDFKQNYRGISKDTYKQFEAFTHDNYEGRIVFPISNITGKLIAVIGRYAFSEATPKYLIDPSHVKLPIYPPKPDIYKDSIILVEGIFDVLNLYDKGLTNVVCGFGKSMGETKKRDKRVEVLNKFIPLKIQGVKKIFILYDTGADSSAKKLAFLLSELFITEVVLDFPLFSKNKDAGDLNKEEVQQLKEYIYETSSTD